jgi:hypothetical protein
MTCIKVGILCATLALAAGDQGEQQGFLGRALSGQAASAAEGNLSVGSWTCGDDFDMEQVCMFSDGCPNWTCDADNALSIDCCGERLNFQAYVDAMIPGGGCEAYYTDIHSCYSWTTKWR